MKIYGDSNSGNCLKVKWVCDRLALPYRWISVDTMKRETRTPQFLALNSAGQVPVIELDDGRTLAQSNAIIRYLARGSALIPQDAFAAAKMDEWLFWEQYSHEPYVAVVRFRMRFQGKARAELDAGLIAGAEAAMARLETALTGRRYLVGEAISLADICLVGYTRFAADAGFTLADYPGVDAWVARLEAELPIKEPR
jgi:glutathione S-transferase